MEQSGGYLQRRQWGKAAPEEPPEHTKCGAQPASRTEPATCGLESNQDILKRSVFQLVSPFFLHLAGAATIYWFGSSLESWHF